MRKLCGKTRYYKYRDRTIMHKSVFNEIKTDNVKGEEQFNGLFSEYVTTHLKDLYRI